MVTRHKKSVDSSTATAILFQRFLKNPVRERRASDFARRSQADFNLTESHVMAFVPDEALDNAAQVSKTAFALYIFLCRWRNHKHQNSILNFPAAQATLALSRSQIYRNISELKAAGWIITRGDFVTPIMGSFERVNRSRAQSQICDTPSQICDEKSQICENTPYMYPAFKSSLNGNGKNNRQKDAEKNAFSNCPNRCENGYYLSKLDRISMPCPEHWTPEQQQEI